MCDSQGHTQTHPGAAPPAHQAGISTTDDGVDCDLIDVSGLSLDDIQELDQSVLAHALRRVLPASSAGEEDPIAAFQSFI